MDEIKYKINNNKIQISLYKNDKRKKLIEYMLVFLFNQ